jgi:glycosyltransferase involved in cell wall biosynthesis
MGRLSRFIAHVRPDIVNSHLFRSTAIAAPLARWHGARAVETYHGREGWRQGFAPLRFLPDRVIGRCLDRVIAVSEAARNFLIRAKGYRADKITVVPNGRDLSVFTPGRAREAVRKELGLDRAVPLVAVVGRLEPQKGHAYLLDAWPAVTRELPDARLLVIGDGGLRDALADQARARGVADSVVFAGFRADVPRMLDAIDVLCLPSLYEGTPLALFEAMAAGKAIVATAVDGNAEVLEDGRTGLLVPARDPAALAQAVLRVLEAPTLRARLGAAARQASRDYDIETTVRRLEALYDEVLAGAGTGRAA